MKNIRNIIFDFGNVLLDINPNLSYTTIESLLGKKVDLEKFRSDFIMKNKRLETGELAKEVFVNFVLEHCPHTVNAKEVIDAWNAMLVEIKPSRFTMLQRLKRDYNVYLLSNTNGIHLKWVYNYLRHHYKVTDWDERYFHKTYYSHLVGMRKPNPDIFEFVLKDAGIAPEETLFIDDTLENLVPAASLGFKIHHHKLGAEIVTYSKENLLSDY